MPRYDTVLLDADNTLFDFDAAEHAALRRALEERGYPFTPETEALYLDINRPLWAAFDRGEVTQDFLVVERFRLLVERLGGSDDPVSFNRDYLTYLGEGNQLLPGAEDLCRDLRAAGCRLALATNGVARVQHARLDASPLKPYFSAVIISQEVGAQKPQPAFFQAALEALQEAQAGLDLGMTPDAVLTDVEAALERLGELTGRAVREDVVDRIFSRFCVGK